MNNPEPGTLVKLSEIDETIAGRDDDIRGRTVKDVDGEDLGTVKDLLVDEAEKRVRFLEVASGGFLGIGQDTSLIPVDAISAITDDEVKIAQSRETASPGAQGEPRQLFSLLAIPDSVPADGGRGACRRRRGERV